jgi:glycosyltransferase involved in cell wall biosynthesis
VANVVIGARMKERLVNEEIDRDLFHVIANWASADLRPVAPLDNPLLEEWNLHGKFVVGYSGNMGRVHEFDSIMGAARALRDDDRVVFLLIGGGAQRVQLEAVARRDGLANIRFRPYQPRELLAQSLSIADIHLVSLQAQLEGLVVPSKIYGVLGVGRPAIFIGSPHGEVGAELQSAECGICVNADDVQGLADAISTLASDHALRRRMGHNARCLYERRYERAIAFAAWEHLLDALNSTGVNR